MIGALSFNLIVLLVRLLLSQKSKIPEKEEKKRLGQASVEQCCRGRNDHDNKDNSDNSNNKNNDKQQQQSQ